MGLTNFPNGIWATPNLGGSVNGGNVSHFPGLWTKRLIFVDGTNGNDANSGLAISEAKATLTGAVAIAGTDDTIYIRPKAFTADWIDLDPRYTPGYTATYVENVSVAATGKHGLSIIGTGNGGAFPGVMMAGVTGATTSTIRVLGDFVNIENISFGWAVAQTVTGVVSFFNSDVASAGDAYGGCISNCYFDRAGNGATIGSPAMVIDSVSACTVQNNIFDNCAKSVQVRSTVGSGDTIIISGNKFVGVAASVVCDLWYGDCDDTFIAGNIFGHAAPTKTAEGEVIFKYIHCVGTVAGHFVGNYEADASTAIADHNTLSNITPAGNYGRNGLMST